jgi:hypothetical protein
MERGRHARRQLLSDRERSAFPATAPHHRDTTEQHWAHRTTVNDRVGTLVATRYGSGAHAQAAQKLTRHLQANGNCARAWIGRPGPPKKRKTRWPPT